MIIEREDGGIFLELESGPTAFERKIAPGINGGFGPGGELLFLEIHAAPAGSEVLRAFGFSEITIYDIPVTEHDLEASLKG